MDRVDRNANAALHARFDEVHTQYAKLRDGVNELQRDLAAMEMTVKSPDGMVTVVVGPRGNLKRLSLHERAYQEQSPERLAALITEASHRAEAAVAQAIQERMRDVIPEGAGLEQVLRRHDERMGYRDEH